MSQRSKESPSQANVHQSEDPATTSAAPTTPIKRRGLGLFSKRNVSIDGRSDRIPTSALAYQPRIKATAATSNSTATDEDRSSQHSASATASASGATTSSVRGTSSSHMQTSTPAELIARDGGVGHGHAKGADTVTEDDFPAAKRSMEALSTAMPAPLNRRQNAAGVTGNSGRPERHHHLRRPSWTTTHALHSRPTPKRRVSSPLDFQANQARRESLPGAKPVTPSFHPDAPPELKVKSPINPVLLPFLSIPGLRGEGEAPLSTSDSSPTSPPDFKADDVMRSTSIKLQRPSIKVRIITWNQGSSVPKGNLEVLLGRVGEYIPPQEGWDESSDEEGETDPKPHHRHRGMGVAGQEDTPRKERIPPLPHDDAHPYHVVVIAGQECPWGDGKRIATGVGLAGELGDLSRSKSRAAQHAKKKEEAALLKEKKEAGKVNKEAAETVGASLDERAASSAIEGEFPFLEPSRSSVPSTPAISIPATPGGGGGGVSGAGGMGAWGIGGKGWSDMCEDWLCRGPLAQATATKGLAKASKGITSSPMATPVPTPEDGLSPVGSRPTTPSLSQANRWEAAAAPLSIQTQGLSEPAKPMLQSQGASNNSSSSVLAQDHFYSSPPKRSTLAVPRNIGRSISFVTRSREAIDGSSSSPIEERTEDEALLHSSPTARPLSPLKQSIDANARIPAQQQKSLAGKPHHRLGLHIPGLSGAHHVTVQSDGTPLSLGAYELVAKERCYMMYMAVYVWRGCLDRVSKTSQGHVKSGLLSGRVGNKGAVGISLKLGSSRLLFVNAHLAAHEGKVAERVANVEKIKKELKVDTFLPKDDPRNSADDLTSAFDYAFWFGDLNFRVDISRQHADWLLMKKQYNDALAFDQLKRIMKEQPRVFDGFVEAPITFPPTFKYDVLKTIKQKREEKAKKHHAAATAAWSKAMESDGNVGDASAFSNISGSTHDSVASSQTTSMMSTSQSKTSLGVRGAGIEEEKEVDDDDDASSLSSSGWGGSGQSTSAGNQSDRDERRHSFSSFRDGDLSFTAPPMSPIDPVVSSNTAAAEGHRLHGKAIKVKKRFFDVVHSLAHPNATSSTKEDHVPQIVKTARKIRQKDEDDRDAAAFAASPSWQGNNGNGKGNGDDDDGDTGRLSPSASRHARSDSTSTVNVSQRPNAGDLVRRRSSAGDLVPGKPLQKENSGESSSLRQSDSIAAMAAEYERQPYDTSAKQRVPSWCDRVLWKSNVALEDGKGGEEGERAGREASSSTPHTFHSRMGTALSNALTGGSHHKRHLPSIKTDGGPTVTFAQMPDSPTPLPRHSTGSAQTELPDSPLPSSHQHPRRRWFHKKGSHQQMKRSTTMDPQDLAELSVSNRGIGKRTMSDVELPSMQRSASDQKVARVGMPLLQPRRSSLEVPKRRSLVKEEGGEKVQEHGKALPPSQEPLAASPPSLPNGHQQPSRRAASSNFNSNTSVSTKNAAPTSDAALQRTSWWNEHIGVHLPSFLSPQTAMNALSNLGSRNEAVGTDDEGEEELIGPARGQIECLLYKSLDDREMRLLEGRSDHRPVIWVGNVGV